MIGLGHDNGVQIAALEGFGENLGIVFFKHQRHIRRALAQRHNQFGQQIGGNGENQAEFERAVQFVLLFVGQMLDQIGLFQHAAGLGDDTLARFGGDDVVAAPVKQRYGQLFFQFFNGNRKGGLADEAAAGGASEMALLRHCNDVAQFG